MILSLKAASVGLNLVADSLVLIMDPWWNPLLKIKPLIGFYAFWFTCDILLL